MDLEFIVKKTKDEEDGRPYELHVLVNTKTDRVWGYVQTPLPENIMYESNPYHGITHWYITLDSAKSYLESQAILQEQEESLEFTKQMKKCDRKKTKL